MSPAERRLIHIFRDPEIGEMAKVAAYLDAVMANTYLSTAVITAMIACLTTTGAFLSIHSGSPSTTGANEIIGSTMSGYSSGGFTGARKAITWAAFSGTSQVSNDTQTFALLATQASGIPNFGLWTADGTSGGTYLGGGTTSGLSGSIPNGANVIFTNGVTLSVAD